MPRLYDVDIQRGRVGARLRYAALTYAATTPCAAIVTWFGDTFAAATPGLLGKPSPRLEFPPSFDPSVQAGGQVGPYLVRVQGKTACAATIDLARQRTVRADGDSWVDLGAVSTGDFVLVTRENTTGALAARKNATGARSYAVELDGAGCRGALSAFIYPDGAPMPPAAVTSDVTRLNVIVGPPPAPGARVLLGFLASADCSPRARIRARGLAS